MTEREQSPPDLSPTHSWRMVILCAMVCLLDGFDMVIAPVSLPSLSTSWGLQPEQFSGLLASSVIGMAIGAMFLAPQGDRFGRRPVILICAACISASSLMMPLASSVTELVILRFITGMGMGASISNALTLVSEYSIPKLRSRIIACVYAMSALGGALGGLVAPAILSSYGWQGAYIVGGLLPLLFLPILFFFLSESQQFLQYKNSQQRQASPGEASEGFIAGLTKLLTPTYRVDTFLLWALFFLCMFTTYMISSWLPTLMHLSGWTIDNSARAIMAFSFGGVIGGFVLGWLVDKGRVQTAVLLGFAKTAVALLLLKFVPDNVLIWMLLIVVMGSGCIGVSYALVAVAAIIYPTELRAGGIGAGGAIGRLGASIAPLMGGGLLAMNIEAIDILTGLILPMVIALIIILKFSHYFSRHAAAE